MPDVPAAVAFYRELFGWEIELGATSARCNELGGTTAVPPTDVAPGRFAVLNDPQGGTFSVIKLAEPATS